MRITESVWHACDPQRTFEMLADPEYQALRCQQSGAVDQSVTVEREPDGSTSVVTSRQLPSDGVPEIARALVGPHLLVVETLRWGPPDADGEREGAMSVELPGIPVTFTGGVHLRRDRRPGVTAHVVEGNLEATIPFLGRKVEQLTAEQISQMVRLEQQVGEQWLADHPAS